MFILTDNEFRDLVCSSLGIGKADFESRFSYIVNELVSLYGEKNVLTAAGQLRGEYRPSAGAEMQFLAAGEQEAHDRFLARSRAAFLTVWKERARANVKGENDD